MNVLVLNCGSSSLSFKVFAVNSNQKSVVAAVGKAKNVGTQTKAEPVVEWEISGEKGLIASDLSTHRLAAQVILGILAKHGIRIDAIGHRFVHGGERFKKTILIGAAEAQGLKECFHLAPIHNPNSFSVFEVCSDVFPAIPQYAVFDTAFHAHLPEEAKRYAIPREISRKFGFRKFGFHGLSYQYISQKAAEMLEKPIDEIKLIMCHLGTGGSSVTAFGDGHSIETSMGYSPLPGLVMSTRCGDIDAEVVLELMRNGYEVDAIDSMLNRDSGLIGLSGFSSNLMEVIAEAENGNEDCHIAYEVYANRLKFYMGAYFWLMRGVDAIVFTDDIGVRCWPLRLKTCAGMEKFGIQIDEEKNHHVEINAPTFVNSAGSQTKILVIPTDEEFVIYQEVAANYSKNF